jgi:hypothetical protein
MDDMPYTPCITNSCPLRFNCARSPHNGTSKFPKMKSMQDFYEVKDSKGNKTNIFTDENDKLRCEMFVDGKK